MICLSTCLLCFASPCLPWSGLVCLGWLVGLVVTYLDGLISTWMLTCDKLVFGGDGGGVCMGTGWLLGG